MQVTRRTATGMLLASLASPAVANVPAHSLRAPTRGFALPDWLSEVSRVPSPALLQSLRASGFQSVRLPVDPAYVSPATLGTIASVLNTVTGLGFNAIVDLHPSGEVDGDQIALAWTLLSPVLADTSPEHVFAELLNEPPMEPETWRALRDHLAGIIRKAAPRHTLIWGPARYQGIWELDAMGPLEDDNSIVAVHYYSPLAFTHQAETWDDSPLARLQHLPFPATSESAAVVSLAASLSESDRTFLDQQFAIAWTEAQIDRDFADLASWSKRHRTTAMLGEFGVLNFSVDHASRERWVRCVRSAAEANNIGWIYWEADQGFGFLADRAATNGIDRAMVKALLA